MKNRIICLLAVLLLSQFSAEAAPIDGRLTLGYYNTSGNTDEVKTNFAFNLSEKHTDKVEFDYTGQANYAKTDGVTSADKQTLGFTSEFIKDEKNSSYVKTNWLKDKFAGYQNKFDLGAGLYKYFMKTANEHCRASLGCSITKEDLTDGENETNGWLRAGLSGKKKLRDKMFATSSLDFGIPDEKSEDRYQIDASLGTVCGVNDRIDVEMSYVVNYRRTPLVEGKRKTDNSFMTSLVYKI